MKFTHPPQSQPLSGYTIQYGVGVGGFGEVYYAISEAGKKVALKKIQRNLEIELRGVRQCLNLKHVNLIALWDIRTTPEHESWVVMEYVPGPSLRDVIESHPGGMPDELIQRWFVSIASGVAYLHQQAIVHRDLKPGNIFLDEDSDVIKIGDYGLSKFIHPTRRSGQTEAVGTFHYMAPEIGRGVYGIEIDIYAIGIILFEMLTGKMPFDGETTQEIIMKHMTDFPSMDGVPARFHAVIQRALEKNPELRYHSVSQMVADLPWPEVASNSAGIIRKNSVGPLNHDRPTSYRSEGITSVAGDEIGGNEIDTFIDGSHVTIVPDEAAMESLKKPIDEPVLTPDIVFGDVKDSRHATTPLASSVRPTSSVRPSIPAHRRQPNTVPNSRSNSNSRATSASPVISIGFPASAAEQIVEMLRSLLIAAMACFSLNLLGLAIGGSNRDATFQSWSVYLWLSLTSLFACGCLLVIGKIWESRSRPPSWRRLKLSGIGLLIGLFTFFVASALGVDLSDASLYGFRPESVTANSSTVSEITSENPTGFASSTTSENKPSVADFSLPVLPAYLIFFAMLFGVQRWWRQFGRLRAKRFSLFPVLFALLLAIILSIILGIPAAPNAILVLVISVSVQLAAPWSHA